MPAHRERTHAHDHHGHIHDHHDHTHDHHGHTHDHYGHANGGHHDHTHDYSDDDHDCCHGSPHHCCDDEESSRSPSALDCNHGSCHHDHGSFDTVDDLLSSNARWVENVLRFQPHFFEESAKGQNPRILWIGCADSRVPESIITLARPGDIFVHRNIANQVHLDDSNGLSVLEYAVDHLHVEHVVVVGHSGCGGAETCLKAAQTHSNANSEKSIVTIPNSSPADPLNSWLEPLTRLTISLDLSHMTKEEALPIVVHENIKEQVRKLAETAIISRAWASGSSVQIHGWVYELDTGMLQDLGISQGKK